MAKDYYAVPSVWDRLLQTDDKRTPDRYAQSQHFDQLRAAIARDLEGLLNTRVAWPDDMFKGFTDAENSVLTYGLRDFAGMCLTSSEDRAVICACVTAVIARFEPRLLEVAVDVFGIETATNRLDFVIAGAIRGHDGAGRVEFSAMLTPSTLQYSVSQTTRRIQAERVAA